MARGRRRTKRGHLRAGGAGTSTKSATSSVPNVAIGRRLFHGKRAWLARLGLAVGVPLLVFSVAEMVLRLAGFGYDSAFFIETAKHGIVTTNDRFVWFYHRTPPGSPDPCLLAQAKPPQTLRVVVLGESAAMGTPDPAFGFARILQAMLEATYPDQRIEVVNAAIRGINSHMIVSIARECLPLEVDLFVVYMGNNEICGLYGPESFLARHPALIPSLHQLKTTRVCQALAIAINGPPDAPRTKKEPQTMEFFQEHQVARSDPRRQPVYHNFQTNLARICQVTAQSGAAVLVLTVPVNLRDCPPLASLHRPDLTQNEIEAWQAAYNQGIELEKRQDWPAACDAYRRALVIDPEYADLHFRTARCLLAAGRTAEAYDHYAMARDYDALQFRADSTLNGIIRQVVVDIEHPHVRLLDAERLLAESTLCPHGIPGNEAFRDHVHPSFEGDYELARMIFTQAVGLMQRVRSIEPTGALQPLSRDQCAARLAYTPWDEVNTAAAMVQMMARPPFPGQLDHAERQARAQQAIDQAMAELDQARLEEAMETYREAITAHPDDWHLRYNYATRLYQLKRYEEAIEHISIVVDRFPNRPHFRLCLAHALAQSGRTDQAIAQYRRILEQHPHFEAARSALDQMLNPTGKPVGSRLSD